MSRRTPVSVITLPFTDLNIPEPDLTAQDLLEQGNVLYLPRMAFPLLNEESGLLTTSLVSPAAFFKTDVVFMLPGAVHSPG
ncbi:TPA: hypothetical protein ACOEP6_004941 [Enterobacter ludwigii]